MEESEQAIKGASDRVTELGLGRARISVSVMVKEARVAGPELSMQRN
jgi:hypothetical protein